MSSRVNSKFAYSVILDNSGL